MFAIASGVSTALATGAISGLAGGWLVAVAALTNPLLLAAAFGIGAATAAAIDRIENLTEVWDGTQFRLAY